MYINSSTIPYCRVSRSPFNSSQVIICRQTKNNQLILHICFVKSLQWLFHDNKYFVVFMIYYKLQFTKTVILSSCVCSNDILMKERLLGFWTCPSSHISKLDHWLQITHSNGHKPGICLPTLPLEQGTAPVSETLCSLFYEYETMDKLQKPCNPECNLQNWA